MKTPEEVRALKTDWQHDPIWDIEETEGFEEYRDELKMFSDQCKVQWAKAWDYRNVRSANYNVDRAVDLLDLTEQSAEVWHRNQQLACAQVHATLALVAELKRMNDRMEGV